jgi:hypothetical protein
MPESQRWPRLRTLSYQRSITLALCRVPIVTVTLVTLQLLPAAEGVQVLLAVAVQGHWQEELGGITWH